jgi:flagellar hook assembly protein FlgD
MFSREGMYQDGKYSIFWDGIDKSGQNAPSGVYAYRIESEGKIQSGKITLLK